MSASSETPRTFPSPDRKILTNRSGGPDSLQFADLVSMVIEKQNQNTLSMGFRERDFSYFAVEDWIPTFKPECVKFQGEIPFLYVIQHHLSSAQTPPSTVPPDFFALVDYVAQTTGSGLATLVAGNPLEATNLRTDLRTGLRVRYRFTALPSGDGSAKYYWVERTESGRGGSYRTVSGQRRGL